MKKFISFASIMFVGLALQLQAAINPTRLRCEQMDNPFTVDVVHPRFSWVNVVSDETICGEKHVSRRNKVMIVQRNRMTCYCPLLIRANQITCKKRRITDNRIKSIIFIKRGYSH